MHKKPEKATGAELAVLKALWETGSSTIRELTDRLYPDGGQSHYATVQKLLERLESKSCVRRRLHERINVYTATVEREALIERRLRKTAEDLCDGSLTPLLTHLVGSSRLSGAELASLRELVEGLVGPRRRG